MDMHETKENVASILMENESAPHIDNMGGEMPLHEIHENHFEVGHDSERNHKVSPGSVNLWPNVDHHQISALKRSKRKSYFHIDMQKLFTKNIRQLLDDILKSEGLNIKHHLVPWNTLIKAEEKLGKIFVEWPDGIKVSKRMSSKDLKKISAIKNLEFTPEFKKEFMDIRLNGLRESTADLHETKENVAGINNMINE